MYFTPSVRVSHTSEITAITPCQWITQSTSASHFWPLPFTLRTDWLWNPKPFKWNVENVSWSLKRPEMKPRWSRFHNPTNPHFEHTNLIAPFFFIERYTLYIAPTNSPIWNGFISGSGERILVVWSRGNKTVTLSLPQGGGLDFIKMRRKIKQSRAWE